MTDSLRIVLGITSLLILVIVVLSLKKQKLGISDGFFWLIMALGIFLCSLFPSIPMDLSTTLGFETPSNFVFFAGLLVMLIIIFKQNMTIHIQKLLSKTLIQEVSLMKARENKESEL